MTKSNSTKLVLVEGNITRELVPCGDQSSLPLHGTSFLHQSSSWRASLQGTIVLTKAGHEAQSLLEMAVANSSWSGKIVVHVW